MKIELSKGVPTLPCKSVRDSIAYYRDKLGFELDWDDSGLGSDQPMLAVMSRNECQLCLSEHEHDGTPPVTMWCFVNDAAALYADFGSRGARRGAAPELARWGEICFEIEDPDGNHLSFAQKRQRS